MTKSGPGKILQIIPAHGVEAVFAEDSGENAYPVICWALIEIVDEDDEPYQKVIGMTLLDDSQILGRVDSGECFFVKYLYVDD